ncbi:MAG: sensor histidine kinase [Bacteriovoracaceae bacterium]
MSSLGLMSAGIAHEINNPLSVIIGKCYHLLDCVEDNSLTPEIVKKDIERMKETSERIEKIVKGLSTFSRDGRNDPFLHTSLNSIIKNTLSFCEARLKNSNITLIQNVIDPNLMIECREAQVSQILLNLIHNSFDAVENLAEKWIKIDVVDCDESVKIIVTDSGHGIPENIQHKIMQPFFTTKEVGKGTGLGLSITTGLVKSHNGSIEIDRNHPNTSFVVILPKHQKALIQKVA